MKTMKKVCACVLSLMCCLGFSACGDKEETTAADETTTAAETTAPVTTTAAETTVSEESKPETSSVTKRREEKTEKEDYDDIGKVRVSFGGMDIYEAGKDTRSSVQAAVNKLVPAKSAEFVMLDDSDDWSLYLYGGNVLEYKRVLTSGGWCVVNNNMELFDDSPELNELVRGMAYGVSEAKGDAEKVYYTVDCEEPTTEYQYEQAAIKCTEAWLTSMQSEDTEEYYRNKSFEITYVEEDSGHQKCNYLSCGMVGGKKEFVVEICFTARDCGDDTFYDEYYQEGRYTEAGTYWSGNYICGRFRWEDGKCSLIKFTTRDGSKGIQEGLNGIGSSGYANFFEFARREDYKKILDDSFVPYGSITVSRNITQTEDGKPINIDIYTSYADSETKDSYTAIWDKRAYIETKPTYSTGLYFTDGGTGHMPDTLPKEFSLTFDNYDGDANPDFCCRYDSDADGTYYVLDSVQTDGRIFNLSGRAFEGGIYIAGCTDPSPRLQKTDNFPYIGWKKDKDGYYPTNTNGERIELPELNMYSDRYFLPDDLKLYSENENKVTCFLWNNTDKDITTGGTYSIEISERGEWKTVAEGLSVSPQTVKPREHAEITYDISALSGRYNTVYRIVQKAGGLTAYGNFWLAGKETQQFTVSAEVIAVGASHGTFTVTDNGYTPAKIKTAFISDGSNKYPLTVYKTDEGRYMFYGDRLPEKAGKYKLTVNETAETDIVFMDIGKAFPDVTAEAEIKDGRIEVTLSADKGCEISHISVLKKLAGSMEQMGYAPEKGNAYKPEKNSGNKIVLVNYYEELLKGETIGTLYESTMESLKNGEYPAVYVEFGISEDTTLDQFKQIFAEYIAVSAADEKMLMIGYTDGKQNYTCCKAF